MANNIRKAKEITNKEDINFLLNITEDDCLAQSTIMEMFGEFDGDPRFQPYDYFKVPTGSYGSETKKNKKPFYTTVGQWIFNKGFIEKDLFDLFGYVSDTINSKTYDSINKKLSYAVLEDKVPLEALKTFQMKNQKFMPFVSILSPAYSMKMLTISKTLDKKKKELMKKYEKELKAKDEKIMDIIEKELLQYSKEILEGDPSMDMFDSGARGSFHNNFKNMFVSKGAIKNPDPNKGFDLAFSNYMDGISKEEYSTFASSLAAGPYSRAKKTETGGYWEKLFLSAYQHVVILDKGSDCGTKRTVTVKLTEKNCDDWMYSYIVDGNKLVELTSDTLPNYLNKTVKFRFSSLCEAKDGICNICAGNLFTRLGIKNIGTATPQIPSRVKVLLMKGFHDSTIHFTDMDINKAFGFDDKK